MKKKVLLILNNYIVIPVFFIISYNIINTLFISNLPFTGKFISILFSILIYDILYLILMGIYNNSKKAHITLIIFFFIILLISNIKLYYLDEPLLISDINMVKNGNKLLSLIKRDLLKIFTSNIKNIILILISLTIVIFYSNLFKYKFTNSKKRVISSLVGIFSIYIIFSFNIFSNFLYSNISHNIKDYASYVDYKEKYCYFGIITGMYKSYYEKYDFNKYKDADLTVDLANIKLDNYNKIENNIGTPNIVVILSESFFDTSLLNKNVIYDKNITENFNELKSEGYLINLISPSYGGMTANVTYQLLTGSNMSIYSNGTIPFVQYFKKKKEYPSLVRELKNNKYQISEYTTSDPYNIESSFKKIGFDNYNLINSNNHDKGYFASDDFVADLIIKELQKNNNKQFMLFETMQNHMDYLVTKYNNYDIKIGKSNLSNKENETLLSYGQGVYDADKMLKKVYDYIKTIDSETIIIFFGDHLPHLKTLTNEKIINNLDYFNKSDELTNLYRKYNTQALILSNYDLKLNINNYLSTDNLLLSIINQMDINVSDYYKLLYGTIDYLPAYNKFISIDKDGKIKYTNSLQGEEKEIYELKNSLTYKYYIKE